MQFRADHPVRWIPVLIMMLLASVSQAAELRGFRIVHQENLSIYFDLDREPTKTSLFTLENPHRLVVDLYDTSLATALPDAYYEEGAVKRVRYGVHSSGRLRIVVDLRARATPEHRYVARSDSVRLVIDLGLEGNPALAQTASQILEKQEQPLRDMVVAIDAGHGGKDPGAIGGHKTREKDVTLQIARRLFKRLQHEPGIRPIMIRDEDVFIALRDRIRLAREKQADLFISIHADAIPHKHAKGSSVYVLSMKGASSETAQWLADNENRADLFGDVPLDGMSRDLQQTLIELAQNRTLESSMGLGNELLGQLGRIGPTHKSTVEMANFAVLKSPDIPSVLVETAFISNPGEERKLNSSRFQDAIAAALQSGIVQYFRSLAPIGSLFAQASGSTG